jgi:general secretion pathway protein G
MRTRVSKAFTLVEILIVVVILGILAAIVVPQFTNASQDAQVGNVETQLQTIRSQIELFRVKNNGSYPASFASGAWTDLVGADYMRSAPSNPRNGSTTITAGTAPASAATSGGPGWYFDAATGNLTAAGFNEAAHTWY